MQGDSERVGSGTASSSRPSSLQSPWLLPNDEPEEVAGALIVFRAGEPLAVAPPVLLLYWLLFCSSSSSSESSHTNDDDRIDLMDTDVLPSPPPLALPWL